MLKTEVVEAPSYGCAMWSPCKEHYVKLGIAHRDLLLRVVGSWKQTIIPHTVIVHRYSADRVREYRENDSPRPQSDKATGTAEAVDGGRWAGRLNTTRSRQAVKGLAGLPQGLPSNVWELPSVLVPVSTFGR